MRRASRLRLALQTTLALLGTSSLGAQADVQADTHAGHAGHAAGAHGAPKLGTVAFANSGARAAQASFLRGVALTHSFEYEDAQTAFQAAERADSGFAMAYWLEALTHSQLLWGVDDPAAAHVVLARLGPTPAARLARAGTVRERSFGAAIEAFFADTTVQARTRAFSDSLVQLADRDTTDAEAAAFASLASMLVVQQGALAPNERAAARARASAYAERVFRANPDHPGAAHYLIHVSDIDASYAATALPAARAYAKIAPDAEHALHMPSHVFLKLGLWDDDATSNERSWAASRAWVRSHHLTGADLSFHTLLWLQYAYLQQGRWRAARALIDTARAVLAGVPIDGADQVDARYAVPALEFAYAAETGRWQDVTVALPTPHTGASAGADRELGFLAAARFQHAVAAAMRGDTATLAATLRAQGGVPDSAAAAGRRPIGLLYLYTMDALAARARGDDAAAMARLRAASALEDRVPPVGPPPYLSPHELLGDALLAAGDATGAATEYGRALAHAPNRARALAGLARAQEASGNTAAATQTCAKLSSNWRLSDKQARASVALRATPPTR